MKVVVIGGSGLIGSKVVNKLQELGHEVLSASPSTGVNAVTGEGLFEALLGAEVVIDVANSPSFEDKQALKFFEKSGYNLFKEETAAGIRHHIALSVVGTDRLLQSGYFRAKMAQENIIKASKIPYTILRATQFFEFIDSIACSAMKEKAIYLPQALIQPVLADDVASLLVAIALDKPINGIVELGGPEKFQLDELVRLYLQKKQDKTPVITDNNAPYFGIKLNEQSLIPSDRSHLGRTRFTSWLTNF